MLKSLQELIHLLTPRQKRHFLFLQIIMVVSSVIELFGITSIAPFIGAASDPDILEKNDYVRLVYDMLNFTSLHDFLLFSGIFFLLMIVMTNSVQVLTIFLLSRYATRIAAEFSHALNSYYLHQPLLYHLSNNSSRLANNVIMECDRVGRDLIAPFLRLNARLFSMIILAAFFFLINPIVAIAAFAVLSTAYLITFRVARSKIENNGNLISTRNRSRIKLIQEGYDGIKDIKLTGTEAVYENDYNQHTRSVSRATATIMVLGQSPYYLIEAVAFCVIISIALYFILQSGGIGDSLTILSLYAMLGYRLIPTFQRSYHALADIKATIPAFENIKDDLFKASEWKSPAANTTPLKLSKSIRLENISFTYPGRTAPAVSNVNICIPAHTITVFAGKSGAGKSTLIDIILGLLQPDTGTLYIDDTSIDQSNIITWQRDIGYVPQQIHIADTTLMENIAFGIPFDEIDQEMVRSAAKLACIDTLIEELNAGLMTTLGEKGRQLSGGQRQRIGLARALYHNPDVLVLDEATSALDSATEQDVMESLQKIRSKKTIIFISHREKIMDIADQVFSVSKGAVSTTTH